MAAFTNRLIFTVIVSLVLQTPSHTYKIDQSQDQLFSPSAIYLRSIHYETFNILDEDLSIKEDRFFDLSNIIKPKCVLTGRKDDCLLDLCNIVYARTINRKPAGKYIDSWAKEPTGRQSLNLRWYGDYDQCISIPSTNFSTDGSGKEITPRFCYFGFVTSNTEDQTPIGLGGFNQYTPPYYSACLPSTCSIERFAEIVNPALGLLRFKVAPARSYCQKVELPLNEDNYIAITIYSVVGFFLLCGLIVDVFKRIPRKRQRKEVIVEQKSDLPTQTSISSHFSDLLMCFSPLTNFEKLCTVPSPQPVSKLPNLNAINGIRTLSLFWVITGHVYSTFTQWIDNQTTSFDLLRNVSFQFVIGGYFAVDTFLFLSGFLSYWSLSRRMAAKNFKFWLSLPKIYFHRYLRLTPPYAAVILILLGLWSHLGNGPFYFQGADQICKDNWWANLLYINNFYEVPRQCVGWSWYLAVDMQLFVLVPFIVYLFVKEPIFGWGVALMALVVNFASGATLTVTENLPSTALIRLGYIENLANGGEARNFGDYNEVMYVKPYTRLGPYVVGVICCHLLVRHQAFLIRRVLNNAFLQLIGWTVSLATILAIVFAQYDVYSGDRQEPRWLECFYNAFTRTAWGIAVGWVVLACSLNSAGIVGNILNWPFWAVLARLSYSGYLLHPLALTFYCQTSRRSFYLNDVTMIFTYLGVVFATLIVSVPFSLAFESPIIGLLRGS